jgi:hypothetical protein
VEEIDTTTEAADEQVTMADRLIKPPPNLSLIQKRDVERLVSFHLNAHEKEAQKVIERGAPFTTIEGMHICFCGLFQDSQIRSTATKMLYGILKGPPAVNGSGVISPFGSQCLLVFACLWKSITIIGEQNQSWLICC